MKCQECGEIKLSKEFPAAKLVETCDHPSLHCLRCVTSHWEQTKQCSQCHTPIARTSLNLRKCFHTLEVLFPEIHPDQSTNDDDFASSPGAVSGKMTVIRLNGEAAEIDCNPRFTIYKVKQLVFEFLKVPPEKQRLVYNGKELKDIQSNNSEATLATYNVRPGSTIHLMVLLYAVPTSLNKVVFDLYWGYPARGRDYLDASALMFSGSSFIEVADYRILNKIHSILHSGDLMDDCNMLGHHIINVEFHSIPAHVTSIFFTLSAWNSPKISHFKTPSLKFYEQSNPSKKLCEDKISKAGHRQAIVMCSLSRRGGQWFVDSNGSLSDGNARNYSSLIVTIQGLIAKMGQ
ncbi:uncharacterized protein LOC117119920 isoform X1 [Anneissia japonica]|uniref:uncharacterized protein LOC117119920 isoform X1 n=1 Tax=Anneissia japonica TaxID=1529436 RepID=UPI0014258664|nr:uncharacterized protein LOC117119920 isoform X1 [Anneissia japonica]XP_033120791.1 uncharacterized protein LOC117119920 isoform X1 [Anneissia japonica]XP_033120792.1 uncharacterized protein LOC117119920 isoform X2 [Anneissia japonica]XP_033120793.1 uncharacterized protein LOC117119920 isoform X1 [Anneissia japonica]